MTPKALNLRDNKWKALALVAIVALLTGSAAFAADEPDLIFRRSTVFKWLTPNDKLATYGVDDPEVEGVACHFTVPEKGGVKGWLGVAEQVSDISLACRQIGPIYFKGKMEQAEDMFRQRRSLFFKKMQIVRGCDAKRNVLVYMVIPTDLSKGRRRIQRPRCRSCPGARAMQRFKSAATSFSDADCCSLRRSRRAANYVAVHLRGPNRGMHFCALSIPLAVILEP